LLVKAAARLRPGRALDLACGPGRHALYLAQMGWQVTAVDAAAAAVELLRKRAAELHVSVDARVADLEAGGFTIEPDAYDLICDFFYLQRGLFPPVRAGIRPGGLFVAAIHMRDESPGLKPMRPQFLLAEGELRREFEGWDLLHYSEREPDTGHSRRVARIVARRRSMPSPPALRSS